MTSAKSRVIQSKIIPGLNERCGRYSPRGAPRGGRPEEEGRGAGSSAAPPGPAGGPGIRTRRAPRIWSRVN